MNDTYNLAIGTYTAIKRANVFTNTILKGTLSAKELKDVAYSLHIQLQALELALYARFKSPQPALYDTLAELLLSDNDQIKRLAKGIYKELSNNS